MSTVKAFTRTTSGKKEVNIRFRYLDGRNIQLFHKSEILINPEAFDTQRECVKKRIVFDEALRKKIDNDITERKKLIKNLCDDIPDKSILSSKWLESVIDKKLHPEKYIEPVKSFFDIFDEFLKVKKFSDWRYRAYQVVIRAMKRFELYRRLTKDKSFKFDFDTVTPNILTAFDEFLRKEHTLSERYPGIYESVPESRTPKPRGQNTINGIFTKIRTLFIWANKEKITANNPFENFEVKECKYGTPIYITIDERNKIYNTDLSNKPELSIQRDIFVFQCLIGCRVSDLYRLSKKNVINGAIEYVAGKTKDDRPITVRVPLNSIAKEIIDKYSSYEDEKLFPFTYEQKYNEDIKEIFTIAGITRPVVTLDTLTRDNVIRPINEIASSHLARRCFVGNLYKQVKDPNLVGALSGHKEGSRAFARYREIDEEIKRELVKMLE